MERHRFRKTVALILGIVSIIASLSGCAGGTASVSTSSAAVGSAGETKLLRVAAAPGPYGDMFDEAIKPYLEKLGYTVKITEFSDGNAAHEALLNKELDCMIIGHLAYEKSMEKNLGKVITPIYVVPTAGAGIYSHVYKSLSEIKDGATVAVANDTTNFPRALRILQAAGLIKLDPKADPFTATEADIAKNPHHLKLVQVDCAQTARSLDSVDLAVIHGNYAFASGIDFKTALYTEVLDENYKNCIVVDGSRVGEQFVKDIQKAAASHAFKKALSADKYKMFQAPIKSIPDKFYTDQGLEVPNS